MVKFRATIELNGKTATGIEVPEEIVTAPGAGKRPPVLVTLGDYTYRTTVARMGGRFLVGINAEHRAAAGVAAGEQVDVEIVADTGPREVAVPDDLATALAQDAGASDSFDRLSYTHRKEWVRWIEEAKKPEPGKPGWPRPSRRCARASALARPRRRAKEPRPAWQPLPGRRAGGAARRGDRAVDPDLRLPRAAVDECRQPIQTVSAGQQPRTPGRAFAVPIAAG